MHNVTHAPAQRIIAPHRIKHEDTSSIHAVGETSRNVAWDRRLALAHRVRIGGRGCASGWGEAVGDVHRGGNRRWVLCIGVGRGAPRQLNPPTPC
jgi:hypothetical protein